MGRWLEPAPNHGEPIMLAAIRKAAPLAALAVAAILAGCAVEPAPYYGGVYAYSGPPAVFVDPCCDYGFYGGYDHHDYHRFGGGGFHEGGGFHGGGGGMRGRG
jgi:hypothetical protein